MAPKGQVLRQVSFSALIAQSNKARAAKKQLEIANARSELQRRQLFAGIVPARIDEKERTFKVSRCVW